MFELVVPDWSGNCTPSWAGYTIAVDGWEMSLQFYEDWFFQPMRYGILTDAQATRLQELVTAWTVEGDPVPWQSTGQFCRYVLEPGVARLPYYEWQDLDAKIPAAVTNLATALRRMIGTMPPVASGQMISARLFGTRHQAKWSTPPDTPEHLFGEEAKGNQLQESPLRNVAQLLQSEPVQHELHLTRVQLQEVMAALSKIGREMAAEVDKALARHLAEEQRQRLKQLKLQNLGLRAFVDPEVREHLQLTNAQHDQIRGLLRQSAQDRGGPYTGRQDRRAWQQRSMKQILAVLTDQQKSQWAALRGEEFRGRGLL